MDMCICITESPCCTPETINNTMLLIGCVYVHSFAKSCLTLATPRTVACQALLSRGFSRQEYWSGLHFLLQSKIKI